ncbi:MAG: 4Fe-4S dicluster domain-containing protein [Chitinispirillaceae bacterium]|nr:4Fe-4S dicluster domain-containing protein [Chitinispirillaceae bacterium]
MKHHSFRPSRRGSLPLSPVPAGIEIAVPPETVTILLDPGCSGVIDAGTRVTAGEPLCHDAVYGAFAPVSGIVQRVWPWDGGPRGRFVAVRIQREDTPIQHPIHDPIAEPEKTDSSELKKTLNTLGFRLPDGGIPLLVMLLDEDVGTVVNRWYLEKDYRPLYNGLQILQRLYGTETVNIAVPETLPIKRQQELSVFGRVLPITCGYPQVLAELIIRSTGISVNGQPTMVVDAARLAAMAEAVASGRAVTTMPVSLRFGKRGQTRMFRVPIGMPVGDLLAECGIPVSDRTQVILGGEMRGVAVDTLQQPLLPGWSTVVVLGGAETVAPEPIPCVNCGRCVRNCPVGLRVDLLGRCVEFVKDKELVRLGIGACIDCGMCAAVCMVRRPLAHLMSYGKKRVEAYAKEVRQ